MSEETSASETPSTTPLVDTINQITDKTKKTISTSGSIISQAIIDKMVAIETDKRIELAYKSYKKFEEMQKQFSGLNRPDNITFDVHGDEVKGYTKARMDQIKKDRKTLGEFGEALEKALNENTPEAYDKLNQKFNQVSSGDKGGDKPTG